VQFVLFEKSYDRFHQRSEDIYRIPFSWEPLSRGNTDEIYASNVPAFGPALQVDFPEVEQYTRLMHVHVLSPTCVLTRSSPGRQTHRLPRSGWLLRR
jgi:putative ABC transport system permease protein